MYAPVGRGLAPAEIASLFEGGGLPACGQDGRSISTRRNNGSVPKERWAQTEILPQSPTATALFLKHSRKARKSQICFLSPCFSYALRQNGYQPFCLVYLEEGAFTAVEDVRPYNLRVHRAKFGNCANRFRSCDPRPTTLQPNETGA